MPARDGPVRPLHDPRQRTWVDRDRGPGWWTGGHRPRYSARATLPLHLLPRCSPAAPTHDRQPILPSLSGSQPYALLRRHECKYLITEAQAARVLSYVQPYIEPDPFAARSPNNEYQISSVYLDSEDLRLCQETLGGIRDRFKLRVRAYSDRTEDPVFFEVKSRRDRVITKDRARVRRVDLHRGMAGEPLQNVGEDDLPKLTKFQSKALSIAAEPRILVRYRRSAFQGLWDRSARVTFDRQLRTRSARSMRQFFDPQGWTTVEGALVILELKFNNTCPSWMTEVVKRVELRRTSYSKYANSIESLSSYGQLRNMQ